VRLRLLHFIARIQVLKKVWFVRVRKFVKDREFFPKHTQFVLYEPNNGRLGYHTSTVSTYVYYFLM